MTNNKNLDDNTKKTSNSETVLPAPLWYDKKMVEWILETVPESTLLAQDITNNIENIMSIARIPEVGLSEAVETAAFYTTGYEDTIEQLQFYLQQTRKNYATIIAQPFTTNSTETKYNMIVAKTLTVHYHTQTTKILFNTIKSLLKFRSDVIHKLGDDPKGDLDDFRGDYFSDMMDILAKSSRQLRTIINMSPWLDIHENNPNLIIISALVAMMSEYMKHDPSIQSKNNIKQILTDADRAFFKYLDTKQMSVEETLLVEQFADTLNSDSTLTKTLSDWTKNQ